MGRHRLGVTTVVLSTLAAVAGCTTPPQSSPSPAIRPAPRTSPPPLTSPPPRTSTTTATTEPLPAAPIAWEPCGAMQCGTVTTPLDYARPDGPTIQIAVARRPAGDPAERIGSLVINPGGPGASGIDDLPNELSALDPEVLARFDIVSFDPRGVERTAPVDCAPGDGSAATPAAPHAPPPDPVPTTPAARSALLESDRTFAARCERDSGAILPYVGTVDAARDLDRIRRALGDSTLTFVGHSYGTLLGATYAAMYPTHVRAMVLDGAIDPALSTTQYVTGQAESYEAQFEAFANWCTTSAACAWHPTADPTAALLALIKESGTGPLAAASGPAGPAAIYNALLAGLEQEGSWPALGGALAAAEAGDGDRVSALSGRYASGGSNNAQEAEQAIDCLDHPVDRDPAGYPALAARMARDAPVFGPLLAWDLLGCAVWPASPTRTPATASDPGAPPILVVGATGDPVTPYSWAQSLAGELTGGVLLTWRGQSHVAEFYSPCIRSAVQSYLVDGVTAIAGTTCSD